MGDTTAAQHVALTRTSWKLAEVPSGSVHITGSRSQPYLDFQDDTSFTGSGGCNRIFGRHTGKPPQLIFSKVGSTKMMCREAMETESAFLAVLDSCRSYWVVDEKLELYRADGSLLARLSRR